MCSIKLNTLLYKKSIHYTLLIYKFKRKVGDKYFVEDENGIVTSVGKQIFHSMSLSKIMVLAEMEEELRMMLYNIHSQMRTHKINFDPLNTPEVIYVMSNGGRTPKEVHQYSISGVYIKSHPSCANAAKELTGSVKNSGRLIKSAQREGKSITLGHRWSFVKSKKLNI